jgi:hypothetical protein
LAAAGCFYRNDDNNFTRNKDMIAELKKTPMLAETFEFVAREKPASRNAARQGRRSAWKTTESANSVWLRLPQASPMEKLAQGLLVVAASGAVAWGLALSFHFADKAGVLLNWIQAAVR